MRELLIALVWALLELGLVIHTSSPKLVAVTLLKIFQRITAGRSLPSCRDFHPGSEYELPPIPTAFLQIELAELGDVFSAQLKAIPAEGNALEVSAPNWL